MPISRLEVVIVEEAGGTILEDEEEEAEAEEVTVHRPTIREDFLTEVVVTSAQEQQDLEGVLVMLLLIKVMTLNRAVC